MTICSTLHLTSIKARVYWKTLSSGLCRRAITDISDYTDGAIVVVVVAAAIIIYPDRDPLKPGISVPEYTASHIA
jgi:hypothetical protein